MTDTTCNGWTNYATWRVNLEYFNGGEHDYMNEASAREFVEDCLASELDGDVRNSAVFQYASAFLDDVNWSEIVAAYEVDDECPFELNESGDNYVLVGSNDAWPISWQGPRGFWQAYIRGEFVTANAITAIVDRILTTEHHDPYDNKFVELFETLGEIDAQNENL